MGYFPFFMDIGGKKGVIVGGNLKQKIWAGRIL